MKVIGNKILIKVKKSSELVEKVGGLSVPVGAGEFEVATVLSVGNEIKEKGEIKEGDTIYLYTSSGKEFTHESERYRVITPNEVIVVL
jgi:co-chaperonin GroES (HSP10)